MRGIRDLRFASLNAGLLLVAALVIARFFDSDSISFSRCSVHSRGGWILRGEYFSTQKAKGSSRMNLRLPRAGRARVGATGRLASTIYKRESVLHHGRVFKFQTAPVDPVDAFRGRYVALSFQAEHRSRERSLSAGTPLWAVLTEDDNGFAEK